MTAISISFDIGGVEMRRYDMDAFLTEICECCDRISASRSCYDIDDSQIRNLKREIEDFSIANKDTILSMYSSISGCRSDCSVVLRSEKG